MFTFERGETIKLSMGQLGRGWCSGDAHGSESSESAASTDGLGDASIGWGNWTQLRACGRQMACGSWIDRKSVV